MAEPALTFWAKLLAKYPQLRHKKLRQLAEITGYTERHIGRFRAGDEPPDDNAARLVENVEAWLAKHRANDPGKTAQSDTELAGSTSSQRAHRDTSLLDTSATETPPRIPGTIEEALAMGGVDRSIVWAMLGKVGDDDTEAWDQIREVIKAHWPERKARRGLQPRSRTARGPTKRR